MAITADGARKMVEYANGVDSIVDDASEHIKLAAKLGLQSVDFVITEGTNLIKTPINTEKVGRFKRAIERLGFDIYFKTTTDGSYIAHISW